MGCYASRAGTHARPDRVTHAHARRSRPRLYSRLSQRTRGGEWTGGAAVGWAWDGFLSHCFPVWSGRTGTVNGVWVRPASCGSSEGAWTFPEVVGVRVAAGPSRRQGQRGWSLRVKGGLGRGPPRRTDVKTGRLPGQGLWLHGIQRTGLDVTSNWISSSYFKNNSVRRLESGVAAHAETRTGWQVVALPGPRTSGNARRAGPLPSSVARGFAEEPGSALLTRAGGPGNRCYWG